MNRHITITIILTLAIFSGVRYAYASAPTAGLVGYWNFDEGSGAVANDTSDNNNNGTINGATWVAGKVGNGALSFDGVDDNINLGNMTTFDGSAYATWSFWTKPNALVSGQVLFSKHSGFSSAQNIWRIANTSDGGGDEIYFYIGDGNNGKRTNINALTIGQWVHVVGVYDGTQTTVANRINIYVNGSLVTNVATAGTIPTSIPSATVNTRIGSRSNGDGGTGAVNFYNGSLDDVRIYNRALGATEVQKLYRA
ncbi:MAG: LamG domain-containing protein, partial [Patescibacteria group bacterium]